MKEMRKEDELKFQCVPCAYKKKKIVFSLGHGKKKVQLCKPFNFLILTALKKF